MDKNREEAFLSEYRSDIYEKPCVAVDFLLITIENDKLKVLMIERSEMPFQGMPALPGIFVGVDETLDEAALRGIREEAGVMDEVYLEQLYTWGAIDRDPRTRVISVSYMALLPFEKIHIKAGKRVLRAGFYDLEDIIQGDKKIAFDHKEILRYARERIRNKTEYTCLPFHFVGEEFTLPKLQKIYEILLGKSLYKANFRKKIKEFVLETDKMETEGAHRPSRIYVRNREARNIF